MKNFKLIFLEINFLVDTQWHIDFHCQNDTLGDDATSAIV